MPITLNIKILYALAYGGMASLMGYVSLYYKSLGFSGQQIGLLYAAYFLAALCAQPLWAMVADRRQKRAGLIFACAIGAGTASAGFAWGSGLGRTMGLLILLAVFFSSIGPLLDSLTFHQLKETGRHLYAHYRIWGTLGYMAVVVLLGKAIALTEIRLMFLSFSTMMLLAASGSLFLREGRVQDQGAPRPPAGFQGILRVLRNREFRFFVLSIFLCRSSEAAVMNFFPPYLKSLGGNETLVGLGWGTAVLAETVVLFLTPRWIERWGARAFVLTGLVASSLRWFCLSRVDTPLAAVMVQLFHGLTFGALFAGAVTFVDRLVPRSLKSTGQALYASLGYGLGSILGSLAGGRLYDILGMKSLCLISSGTALLAAVIFVTFVGKHNTWKEVN